MKPRCSCPLRAELAAYVRGEADLVDAAAIVEHLDTCLTCRNSVRAIEAGIGEPRERQGAARGGVRTRPLARCAAGDEPESCPVPYQRTALSRIGNYLIERAIGTGAMATVYRALHLPSGCAVALKVLRYDRTQDSHAVRRFMREMSAVSLLFHPHIVRTIDSGVEETTHYIAMEYLDGFDLRTLSARCGAFSIANCCELARQTAVGLQHTFEHGLVHRDIKPSNLMLSRSGAPSRAATVRILDFGLALMPQLEFAGSALTAVNQAMGSVDYVAPEQMVSSHDVDIRADLYSLGCTLYQLLSGHPPFGGPTYDHPIKTGLAHLHELPIPIADRRADVPDSLAKIVHRLLAKDRHHRFATPGEVAAALEQFVPGSNLAILLSGDGQRSAAPPSSRDDRPTSDSRKTPSPQIVL